MRPDMYRPDPELTAWIEALLDQRISEDDLRRLSDRLRDDPQAMSYCAEVVRFDAAMHDELLPQEIEWTDTRRVTLSKRQGNPGIAIERNQSVRVGQVVGGASPIPPAPRSPVRRYWLPALAILVLGVIGLLFWLANNPPQTPSPPELRLLNGDFEATNLTYLPEPTNPALVDWQDYFVTENADLAEISRVTEGKVLPRSGRNVARLSNFAYLTQRLRRSDNSPLLARPGLKIAIEGWAYVLDAREAPATGDQQDPSAAKDLALRGSLRFVAGGSPGMVQYELASDRVAIEPGEWQPVLLEFILPENLILAPTYGTSQAKLDLAGKEITLSLDSQCGHDHQLLLDDLSIREIE